MRTLILFAATTLTLAATPLLGQEPAAWREHRLAVEALLESRGDAPLATFAAEHLAPTYRDSFADEAALLAHLRALRDTVAPVGGIGLESDGKTLRLIVDNRERRSVVAMTFEDAPPHRLTSLVVERSGPREPGPEVAWDTLEETLEAATEEQGFCGSVLAIRDGEVVLDRGFGFADPARKHPVTADTLFAIGSTPIDFTHGAILKLEEDGLISLDDTLETVFGDVPDDKAGITLDQLRTGRSGLLDFPGIEGVDENLDLSWIDRAEFLRRVFASKLLFEPGTNRRHSHAAWGVLAAAVEVASGRGYEEYLREHFFGPAGMERTGHYPLARKFPAAEVAVGLGGNVWGEVNSPACWGETSWLVLGSGGMVSTTRDLRRWREFLASEAGLGPAARQKYGLRGEFMAEGGNDRGFVNTIGIAGGNHVIVCSNSHVGMDDFTSKLAMAVAELALAGGD